MNEPPSCSGPIDEGYLAEALARASLAAPSGALDSEQLHGGRTGAQVWRLRTGDRAFVVKLVPPNSWRGAGMCCPEGGEPPLFLSGLTRELPDELRWPAIDVALHDDGHYRLLMSDVGAGIRERGRFSSLDTARLFRHMARAHARFFEHEWLRRAPLPDAKGPVRVFTEPLLHLAGRRAEVDPWVHSLLGDFAVLPAFAPIFLDLIGPDLAEKLLDVVEDEHWKERLMALPATLLQGDPRRANIAFGEAHVDIFDWEFAHRGPPGLDLQWHCFLHYWAYPPEGTEPGGDCDEMHSRYVEALGEALGQPVDERALWEGWSLGWIRIVAALGYVLVDPLYPDGGSAEERERVRRLCERAIERALDLRERL